MSDFLLGAIAIVAGFCAVACAVAAIYCFVSLFVDLIKAIQK